VHLLEEFEKKKTIITHIKKDMEFKFFKNSKFLFQKLKNLMVFYHM
jgi:hypothetical protein